MRAPQMQTVVLVLLLPILCGANTYMFAAWNRTDCHGAPVGFTTVGEEARCAEYAVSLGVVLQRGSWPEKPPACFRTSDVTTRVYWNHNTGAPHPDAAPVCVDNNQPAKYLYSGFQTVGCPPNYTVVSSFTDCEGFVELDPNRSLTRSSWADHPPGCFMEFVEADNTIKNAVYYNDHSGGPHFHAAPLCVLEGFGVDENCGDGVTVPQPFNRVGCDDGGQGGCSETCNSVVDEEKCGSCENPLSVDYTIPLHLRNAFPPQPEEWQWNITPEGNVTISATTNYVQGTVYLVCDEQPNPMDQFPHEDEFEWEKTVEVEQLLWFGDCGTYTQSDTKICNAQNIGTTIAISENAGRTENAGAAAELSPDHTSITWTGGNDCGNDYQQTVTAEVYTCTRKKTTWGSCMTSSIVGREDSVFDVSSNISPCNNHAPYFTSPGAHGAWQVTTTPCGLNFTRSFNIHSGKDGLPSGFTTQPVGNSEYQISGTFYATRIMMHNQQTPLPATAADYTASVVLPITVAITVKTSTTFTYTATSLEGIANLVVSREGTVSLYIKVIGGEISTAEGDTHIDKQDQYNITALTTTTLLVQSSHSAQAEDTVTINVTHVKSDGSKEPAQFCITFSPSIVNWQHTANIAVDHQLTLAKDPNPASGREGSTLFLVDDSEQWMVMQYSIKPGSTEFPLQAVNCYWENQQNVEDKIWFVRDGEIVDPHVQFFDNETVSENTLYMELHKPQKVYGFMAEVSTIPPGTYNIVVEVHAEIPDPQAQHHQHPKPKIAVQQYDGDIETPLAHQQRAVWGSVITVQHSLEHQNHKYKWWDHQGVWVGVVLLVVLLTRVPNQWCKKPKSNMETILGTV